LNSGRQDLIAYCSPALNAPDSQLVSIPEGESSISNELSMNGVFGYVSRNNNGKLRQAFLAAGTSLKGKDFVLEAERAEYAATIEGVDRETGWIHLTEPILSNSLVGSVAVIGSPTRSRAYKIKRVSVNGRRFQIEGSLLLYQSKVNRVDVANGAIDVQFPPPFLRCDPNFYDGCIATNENHTLRWKINKTSTGAGSKLHVELIDSESSSKFQKSLNLSEDSFTDADGDGRAIVYMYEIAPGDALKITTHVSVTLESGRRHRIQSNVPYRFTHK
jgi:hypothetical protein